MFVNSVTSSSINSSEATKMRYVSHPIESKAVEQDKQQGYAPVTANLWGQKIQNTQGNSLPAWSAYVTDFGAARPTNNPSDLPAIEADTQSGFRLSSLDQPMICPDCGKPIMTKPIFAGIKAELDEATEHTYLNVIDNHSEFLLPQEEKIVAHMKEVQAKNPEMTLRDVVVAEREKRLDKLEAQQLKILDKIEEVAEVLPYEDRSKITGLMTTSSYVIFQRQNTYAFQRSKFLELVDKLQVKTPGIQEKIRELAEELPSAMDNEDAWYVKYGGLDKKKQPYTSRTIAEKLVSPAYTNTDHVHPWNLGGLDAVSNFWLMHARCNIIKTDKPFVEWLNEDRENRTGYIKQYLKDAQAAIDASEDPKMHPKYDLYSAKLAKTIFNETNGEVDFTKDFPLPEGYDVPKPAEKEKKKAA